MKNTVFKYMYRDASNYKNGGEVIFVGGITPAQLERLERAFDDGLYFIASQISVLEVFLWAEDYNPEDLELELAVAALMPRKYAIGEDDHCWHEFTGASEVDQTPTDSRTIEQFVTEVEAAAASGWLVFEPGAVAA
jgi:hypothetical protein